MASKVESILEEIKGLTLLEAAELAKAMEEAFGVTAAAPVAYAAGAPRRRAQRGSPERKRGAGRGQPPALRCQLRLIARQPPPVRLRG